MKKIIFIILLIIFPSIILGKDFKYEESEFEYKLDDTIWEYKNELDSETYEATLYDSANTSLLILYGDEYEYYSDGNSIDRMYLNYKNLISNDNIYDREEMYTEASEIYGASGKFEYAQKNISFVVYNTYTDRGEVQIDSCKLYETINNGYTLSFEFCKKTDSNETSYIEETDNVLSTVNVTGDVIDYKLQTQNKRSWLHLILGIILTMIYYMAFPFVLFVLFKKKYDSKKITIVLAINSIILGLISALYVIIYTKGNINPDPAFFWYLINEIVFNKERRKKKKKVKKERHEGFEDN